MDMSNAPAPSLPTTPYLAVVVLFVVLATAAVVLRLYTRKRYSGMIAADDYLIVCSLVFCWGLFVTAIVAAAGGGINYVKGDPLKAAILFLKLFFVEPLLEFPALTSVRLSVLFFYKRIFTKKWFEVVCVFFAVVVVGWGLAGFIVELTSADPISNAWDPLNPNPNRINFGAYAVTLNAIGIALDVITLTLPLLIIYGLHMKKRYKFLTAGILWLGIFCVVADSVRLYYTVEEVSAASHATGSDRYYIPRNVWLWDRITPCASVLTACLPTYAPLVKGRNIMESLVRTAGSWFSFGSQGSLRSKRSGQSDQQRTLGAYVRSDSNEQLNGWSPSLDDHGIHTTNVTTEGIELQQEPHFPPTLKGVNVTSTVNLEYSKGSGNSEV